MRWLLIVVVLLCGCTIRPPAQIYTPVTQKDIVQAWADAFNEDDLVSLRQLVHPLKKGIFDQDKARIRQWIRTRQVQSYLMDKKVRINQTLSGRKVIYHYHDGRQRYDVEAVIAEGEGRWWVWSF